MMDYFAYTNDDNFMTLIGMIACNCGKRPSELFEWNDKEDWVARLSFDISSIVSYKNKESSEMKHARR